MNKKATLTIIPFIGILFAAVTASMIIFSYNTGAQAVTGDTNSSNVTKVEAGRGNASAIIDHFFPENAEIKVGQSITWYNPTKVGEPHTVSFVLISKDHYGNKVNLDLGLPCILTT